MNDLERLYEEMKNCSACRMRAGCQQVVTHTGCTDQPLLLICGECPGQEEDEHGEPFLGRAGQCLRSALRDTKIINKANTLIVNVMACRPPKNKFPTDESASICFGLWLKKEIELAKPKRMLLVGATALKYVAGVDGITSARGNWLNVGGIRSMPTFHPSFILRRDAAGETQSRLQFESDIMEVAREIKSLQEPKNDNRE